MDCLYVEYVSAIITLDPFLFKQVLLPRPDLRMLANEETYNFRTKNLYIGQGQGQNFQTLTANIFGIRYIPGKKSTKTSQLLHCKNANIFFRLLEPKFV